MRLITRINQVILDSEKQLQNLNNIPREIKEESEKSYLKDYLEHFVIGRVRGLRIILSRHENLLIELRNVKNGFKKLTMPDIKKLINNDLLTEERFLKLKGLGFSLKEGSDKATAILKSNKEEAVNELIKLLSIIVFEVFYFKNLGDGAAIEILGRKPK